MLKTTKLSTSTINRTPNVFSVLQIIRKSPCPQCALKLITRIHPHFELLLNTSRCLPPPPKFTLFGFKQCDMVSYKLKKQEKTKKQEKILLHYSNYDSAAQAYSNHHGSF